MTQELSLLTEVDLAVELPLANPYAYNDTSVELVRVRKNALDLKPRGDKFGDLRVFNWKIRWMHSLGYIR